MVPYLSACSKINELEEELKVVGNNMKSLEISEQEVKDYKQTNKKEAIGPLHAANSFMLLFPLFPVLA